MSSESQSTNLDKDRNKKMAAEDQQVGGSTDDPPSIGKGVEGADVAGTSDRELLYYLGLVETSKLESIKKTKVNKVRRSFRIIKRRSLFDPSMYQGNVRRTEIPTPISHQRKRLPREEMNLNSPRPSTSSAMVVAELEVEPIYSDEDKQTKKIVKCGETSDIPNNSETAGADRCIDEKIQSRDESLTNLNQVRENKKRKSLDDVVIFLTIKALKDSQKNILDLPKKATSGRDNDIDFTEQPKGGVRCASAKEQGISISKTAESNDGELGRQQKKMCIRPAGGLGSGPEEKENVGVAKQSNTAIILQKVRNSFRIVMPRDNVRNTEYTMGLAGEKKNLNTPRPFTSSANIKVKPICSNEDKETKKDVNCGEIVATSSNSNIAGSGSGIVEKIDSNESLINQRDQVRQSRRIKKPKLFDDFVMYPENKSFKVLDYGVLVRPKMVTNDRVDDADSKEPPIRGVQCASPRESGIIMNNIAESSGRKLRSNSKKNSIHRVDGSVAGPSTSFEVDGLVADPSTSLRVLKKRVADGTSLRYTPEPSTSTRNNSLHLDVGVSNSVLRRVSQRRSNQRTKGPRDTVETERQLRRTEVLSTKNTNMARNFLKKDSRIDEETRRLSSEASFLSRRGKKLYLAKIKRERNGLFKCVSEVDKHLRVIYNDLQTAFGDAEENKIDANVLMATLDKIEKYISRHFEL